MKPASTLIASLATWGACGWWVFLAVAFLNTPTNCIKNQQACNGGNKKFLRAYMCGIIVCYFCVTWIILFKKVQYAKWSLLQWTHKIYYLVSIEKRVLNIHFKLSDMKYNFPNLIGNVCMETFSENLAFCHWRWRGFKIAEILYKYILKLIHVFLKL